MKINKLNNLIVFMCIIVVVAENVIVKYCDANPHGAILRLSIMFLWLLVNFYNESNLRVVYENGYEKLRRLVNELIEQEKDDDNKTRNS